MKRPLHTNLSADRLREVVDYDPETGRFTWRVSTSRKIVVGSQAGTSRKDGYRVIRIYGTNYYAHRLAWLYVTGSWPNQTIDHRDLDPSNNRFGNLRVANQSQQSANSRRSHLNRHGVRCVHLHARSGRFAAQAMVEGRRTTIGYFLALAEAKAAAAAAAKAAFGEFARSE